MVESPQSPEETYPRFEECAEFSSFRNTPTPAEDTIRPNRYGVEAQWKRLPRFGEKLTAAPADVERLQERLKRIYRCKKQAFEWPRFRYIALSTSVDELAKPCGGNVGQLNFSNMVTTVEVFRGGFSQYFGKTHFDASRNLNFTELTPFEAYFLLDAGLLEVCLSANCPIGVEDFRALLEEKVPDFPNKYRVFSEFHRATQLYLKDYGISPNCGKRKVARRAQVDKVKSDADEAESSRLNDLPVSTITGALPVSVLPENLPLLPIRRMSGFQRENVAEARRVLFLDLPRQRQNSESSPSSTSTSAGASVSEPGDYEMPPLFHLLSTKRPSSRLPETGQSSLDVPFTCHSKPSQSTSGMPIFDVAVTPCDADASICDLFNSLAGRSNPGLPLYVARNDNGYLSGFSAQLADIPVVVYQGAARLGP